MNRYRVLFECGGPIVYVRAHSQAGAERTARHRFRRLCNLPRSLRVRWGRAWVVDVSNTSEGEGES